MNLRILYRRHPDISPVMVLFFHCEDCVNILVSFNCNCRQTSTISEKNGQFRLLSMHLAPSSRVSFEICCITLQRVIKSSFCAATRSDYTGHTQQIQIRRPPCQLTMVIIDTVGRGGDSAAAAAALDCRPDSWFVPLGLSAHFNFPP